MSQNCTADLKHYLAFSSEPAAAGVLLQVRVLGRGAAPGLSWAGARAWPVLVFLLLLPCAAPLSVRLAGSLQPLTASPLLTASPWLLPLAPAPQEAGANEGQKAWCKRSPLLVQLLRVRSFMWWRQSSAAYRCQPTTARPQLLLEVRPLALALPACWPVDKHATASAVPRHCQRPARPVPQPRDQRLRAPLHPSHRTCPRSSPPRR
jgi:hypothetical protein